MKSTRLVSGLGRGRAGLRIALAALGLLGITAMLASSVPGSAQPLSTQAGASGRGVPGYSLASAASSDRSPNPPAEVAAPAACSVLSFLAAVNYTVGTGPFSVAAGDLNGDTHLDLATA